MDSNIQGLGTIQSIESSGRFRPYAVIELLRVADYDSVVLGDTDGRAFLVPGHIGDVLTRMYSARDYVKMEDMPPAAGIDVYLYAGPAALFKSPSQISLGGPDEEYSRTHYPMRTWRFPLGTSARGEELIFTMRALYAAIKRTWFIVGPKGDIPCRLEK